MIPSLLAYIIKVVAGAVNVVESRVNTFVSLHEFLLSLLDSKGPFVLELKCCIVSLGLR